MDTSFLLTPKEKTLNFQKDTELASTFHFSSLTLQNPLSTSILFKAKLDP